MLSVLRICIIFPFIMYFLNDNYFIAAFFLIISGLSDMIDGAIARKFNQITKLGKILDPVADKLTLLAVVVCMGIKFPEIIPLVIILLTKDIIMLVAGILLLKRGIELPASKWYGKAATIFFYISVIIIVGLKAIFGISNSLLSIILLSITAFLMIFALIKYFILCLDITRSSKE